DRSREAASAGSNGAGSDRVCARSSDRGGAPAGRARGGPGRRRNGRSFRWAVKRGLLDTNVYIDWINAGAHEEVVVGAGLVRHLSAVVEMELRAGARTRRARRAVEQLGRAYRAARRMAVP